ncbi:transcriptional regulator with XRE-family HTH domain [Gluconobacter cerinus]|uniref:helix-turn-helix transcriptional regulator n=1 Tax=Gluconobacter cerinus TaxID=38307 RepID=UPI002227AC55|nr:helix-turn-helix transcriptional regulator [Gluconobacter cerinus]MCW2264255.1 transcriptional regulator with XRE-family HTH domain [Gluconobacter cerinus]
MNSEWVYKELGKKIRERRDDLGLTQLELAQKIGLARGSVANIEAGRQSVLLHQFLTLCSVLDLDPCLALPSPNIESEEQIEMPENVRNAVQKLKKISGKIGSEKS